MSDDLRTEYKSYPIIYDEGHCTFRAFVDGSVAFENPSLRALKDEIDAFEKKQASKDFKRFKVFVWRYQIQGYVEAEVTSITEGGQYWLSVDGRRSKESAVIPTTDANRVKTTKIAELYQEKARLETEIRNNELSLSKLECGRRP